MQTVWHSLIKDPFDLPDGPGWYIAVQVPSISAVQKSQKLPNKYSIASLLYIPVEKAWYKYEPSEKLLERDCSLKKDVSVELKKQNNNVVLWTEYPLPDRKYSISLTV